MNFKAIAIVFILGVISTIVIMIFTSGDGAELNDGNIPISELPAPMEEINDEPVRELIEAPVTIDPVPPESDEDDADALPSEEPDSTDLKINDLAEREETLDELISVLNIFIGASGDGNIETVREVVTPGSSLADQSDDMSQTVSDSGEIRIGGYADRKHALALSSPVKVDNPGGWEDGYLVFTLVRTDAAWLIDDIDFEDMVGVSDEIERFLEEHPDAQKLD
jgi:hypothetical protein